METFDYVIVGAGSAGSVLANRLSEDGTATVLVLEAGPSDWHPFIHIPAGFIKTFHDPRVNWLYSMEPSEWTGGRRILAPRGKTLGGSSSINGHIYNRGQRMDFDTWAQLGNRGWGYADVLPYFRRMERRLRRRRPDLPRPRRRPDRHRSSTGATRCARPSSRAPSASASRATPTTTAPSRRASPTPSAPSTRAAASAPPRRFLHPARKRPNVTVRTRAHATELLFEGKRARRRRLRMGGRGGEASDGARRAAR